MPDWLVKAMRVELTQQDLEKMLPGHEKIVTSAELDKMSAIPFDSAGRCIILWLQSTNEGHWTCVFYNKDKSGIEYFDPYGFEPGKADSFVTPEQDARLGNITPKEIVDLLNATGLPWTANKIDYQAETSTVATCGRWVTVRLLNKSKTEEEFHSWIEAAAGDLPLDAFVTLVTEKKLGRLPTQ